jgi:hypothetical protein
MGWTDGHEMRGGDCGTGWGEVKMVVSELL